MIIISFIVLFPIIILIALLLFAIVFIKTHVEEIHEGKKYANAYLSQKQEMNRDSASEYFRHKSEVVRYEISQFMRRNFPSSSWCFAMQNIGELPYTTQYTLLVQKGAAKEKVNVFRLGDGTLSLSKKPTQETPVNDNTEDIMDKKPSILDEANKWIEVNYDYFKSLEQQARDRDENLITIPAEKLDQRQEFLETLADIFSRKGSESVSINADGSLLVGIEIE